MIMTTATEILENLAECTKSYEVKPVVDSFLDLPREQRLSAESYLITALKDGNLNNTARSWIPNLMASIGTPAVRQALIDQYPVEKVDTVRLWIGVRLIKNFKDNETINLVAASIDNEPRGLNRQELAGALADSGDLRTLPHLTKLLNSEEIRIRLRVAQGLEKSTLSEAGDPLAKRLAEEESAEVCKAIIYALVAINYSGATSVLLQKLEDNLDDQELSIAVLLALGQLAAPDDDKVISALLDHTCHQNRIVALTATDTLIKLSKADAATRLAKYGMEQTDPERLSRVADALRLAGGTEAINYLKGVRGDTDLEDRAHTLLEQVGGRQAVNVLVNQRLNTLNQAGIRVKEFDEQALSLFNETIQEAKRGFKISLGMSVTIFIVGVMLLVVSIYLMVRGQDLVKLLGAGSGLAGLGTILMMFYNGPLERVERSVSNLVQTEIAFLGYIRQVTQITAMFEREYMDNEEFGIPELKTLLSYTEHTMKETMPLVSQYTAVADDKVNVKGSNKD